LKIHLNIILQSTPRFSKRSSSLRSPTHNPDCTSPVSHTCTCQMLRLSHSSWCYYPNNIWWWVQIIKLLHSLSWSSTLTYGHTEYFLVRISSSRILSNCDFSKTSFRSMPSLGPTQLSVRWVTILFPFGKAAGARRWPPVPI
jgi:hypothetical protein